MTTLGGVPTRIKRELNGITGQRYHCAVVRARAETVVFGEQSTKRALASEKMYTVTKEINSIQYGPILTSGGSIIVNTFVNH